MHIERFIVGCSWCHLMGTSGSYGWHWREAHQKVGLSAQEGWDLQDVCHLCSWSALPWLVYVSHDWKAVSVLDLLQDLQRSQAVAAVRVRLPVLGLPEIATLGVRVTRTAMLSARLDLSVGNCNL